MIEKRLPDPSRLKSVQYPLPSASTDDISFSFVSHIKVIFMIYSFLC